MAHGRWLMNIYWTYRLTCGVSTQSLLWLGFDWKKIQIRSVVQSCPTLCNPMNRSMPGLPVHHQLPDSLRLTSIESVMSSNHLILYHPLLPPSNFPSIRVFSNESVFRIRWPKYWSFSFNISVSNEHSGFISLKMDWVDLLAVQGTLKSLLQHHNSKASILQCTAFFMIQLSHLCVTSGKIIALTTWTFVSVWGEGAGIPGIL